MSVKRLVRVAVSEMKILGIDFTSAPGARKPITCVEAELSGSTLHFRSLLEWTDFHQFENALEAPGPWIAGIDLPFGQSRTFIHNIGWPQTWAGYVTYVSNMTRQEFRATLDDYRQGRATGDKEHRRECDIRTGAISPQKLYGVPVGLMFFEGAPRILRSGATIPGLQDGDPSRVVLEVYPGLLARKLLGRRTYKHDTRARQTVDQLEARRSILEHLTTSGVRTSHLVEVEAPASLAEDPSGDQLDALLCTVQTVWAWQQRTRGYGIPRDSDSLEGWIVDPGAAS